MQDLSSTKYPYYRVYDEKGKHYCDCGWEKHAQELLLLNRGKRLTYRRIDAPKPLNPETVDVSVTPTEQLSGQQGLPRAVDRLPFEPEEYDFYLPENDLEQF